MKWRYVDEERQGGSCYDCELAYRHFPIEMVIDNETWELINPTYHEGAGLLCHNCMIARLRKKDIDFVTVKTFLIRSLPLWAD